MAICRLPSQNMSLNSPTEEEVSLARQLADPDKAARDRACQSLVRYVQRFDGSDLDMLKFWKCLYYCLWLSDKAPIQHELAMSLSNLLHACPNEAKAVQFLTAFYRTILREWTHLDQYRVNKFYTLLRFVLRQLFHFLCQRDWARELTEKMLDVLRAEVFDQTPNGPRLHYADIYLTELLEVTKGTLQTRHMMLLLTPMVEILVAGTDTAFKDRVAEKVLGAYADRFASERVAAAAAADVAVFAQVRTGAIQHMVFAAASDESTREGNRKRLYDAHKLFQKASGEDFAPELLDVVDEVVGGDVKTNKRTSSSSSEKGKGDGDDPVPTDPNKQRKKKKGGRQGNSDSKGNFFYCDE